MFFEVVRSLTIVFTIIFTRYILHQTTSKEAIRACAVVVVGFVMGSLGEINFTWLGVFFGVASSAFVSLYGIFVKRIMVAVDGDQW